MTPQSSPDRWRRVEALFFEALDRQPSSRAAFLQGACGDDVDLRREVEELLVHTDATLSRFRQPVNDAVRELYEYGQLVGPFRLIRLLGEGGMGAVYLAERADEEYRQQVAIKLMRTGLGRDSEMLHRFRTERQILADLNHPYIARLLHGGTTPQGAPYLVMEYIDGAAIDKDCADRDLPVPDRVRLFLKVCEAVEYAHGKHVIHRDIKPANILVTPAGEPKLLDFGIAKLFEPGSGKQALVTRSTGRLMTPEYASPEQVHGQPLTSATDIYSLGTVLYELVAGKHPFTGENRSPVDLGRMICETGPDPPSVAARAAGGRPASPSGRSAPLLDRIILTAMRKNPADRYGSVADFAASLRGYLEGVTTGSTGTANVPTAARGWLMLALMVIAGIIGALGFAAYVKSRSRETTPFNSMQMTRMTARGDVADVAVSSDSKFVAYVLDNGSQQSLWLTQPAINGNQLRAGPQAGTITCPLFTRDGSYLYYLLQDGGSPSVLYRVPILGGEPKPVFEGAGSAVALSPDGKQFAFVRIDPQRGEAAIRIANVDGTGVHDLAVRRRPAYFARSGLAWSPDGNTIACFAGNSSFYTPEAFRILTIDVKDGRERFLTAQSWAVFGHLAWLGDGRSLVASTSEDFDNGFQIWLASYPGGEVWRVTNDLGNYTHVGVSADGRTMVAVATDRSGGIWVASPTANPAEPTLASPPGIRGLGTIAWDPRGGILYSVSTGDARNIWRLVPNGGPPRQITNGAGFRDEMTATPDGRYILYSSAGKIWRMNPEGDQPLQLTHGALDVHPSATPDSRWVLYGSFPQWSPVIGGKPTVWKVPIDGGEPVQLTEMASSIPKVSPDGKMMAYLIDDPGRRPVGIGVGSIDGRAPQRIFDIPQAQWSADGKSLYYAKSEHGVENIWRQPIVGGPPIKVTNFAAEEIPSFAVSRDGRLAIERRNSSSDVVLIRNFR